MQYRLVQALVSTSVSMVSNSVGTCLLKRSPIVEEKDQLATTASRSADKLNKWAKAKKNPQTVCDTEAGLQNWKTLQQFPFQKPQLPAVPALVAKIPLRRVKPTPSCSWSYIVDAQQRIQICSLLAKDLIDGFCPFLKVFFSFQLLEMLTAFTLIHSHPVWNV